LTKLAETGNPVPPSWNPLFNNNPPRAYDTLRATQPLMFGLGVGTRGTSGQVANVQSPRATAPILIGSGVSSTGAGSGGTRQSPPIGTRATAPHQSLGQTELNATTSEIF